MIEETFRLCYVSSPWAWFTTQPVEDQWGDDWDDAPFQHNAGRPYDRVDHEAGKVAFDGPLHAPGDPPRLEYDGIGSQRPDSGVSVEEINTSGGDIPWLVETSFHPEKYGTAGVEIPAGTSLPEFIELAHAADGAVYTAVGFGGGLR